MPHSLDYYCSYRFGRTILMGMEEVIGRTDIDAILNLSGLPFLAHTYLLPGSNSPIAFKQLKRHPAHYGTVLWTARRGRVGFANRAGGIQLWYS